MKVEVRVYPREGVLDPQGKAIAAALGRLGHRFRPGRPRRQDLLHRRRGTDPRAVEADARKMAEELLANTVIEGFDVRVP